VSGANPSAWSIRSAADDDLEELATIHRAAILQGCRGGYSGTQLRAWLDTLTPASYADLQRTRSVRVAVDDGALCGFVVTSPGKSLVAGIYVAPFGIGRGAGQALLADAEQSLLAAGRHEAVLHSTTNAVDFFRWLGYRDEGDATKRLPSGVALACVAMRKPIS